MSSPVDNCAICLCALSSRIHVPCSNDHRFHKKCLMEWATTLHNCPICREKIKKIRVLNGSTPVKTIKPPKLIREKREQLDTANIDGQYDTMYCEICEQATDEARMLICDACDLGFHMYCLQPPLRVVPRGLWECETCRNTHGQLSISSAFSSLTRGRSRAARSRSRYEEREEFISLDHIDDKSLTMNHDADEDEFEEESDEGKFTDTSEESEIDDNETKNNRIEFISEDELILHDDPDQPSTSYQPTVTFKEEIKKGRKAKKKTSRKTKRRKKCNGGKSGKTLKRKHTRRHKKKKKKDSSSSRRRGGNRESISDGAHRRIADICGIDLRHSDRYKLVRRGNDGAGTSRSGGCASNLVFVPGAPARLDLLGRDLIPPSDNHDVNSDRLENQNNGNSPVLATQRKSTGSVSLLDEILTNQSIVLAPGRLLKVSRDGTLQKTDQLCEYLDRKNRKTESKTEKNSINKAKSSEILSCSSTLLAISDATKICDSALDENKKSHKSFRIDVFASNKQQYGNSSKIGLIDKFVSTLSSTSSKAKQIQKNFDAGSGQITASFCAIDTKSDKPMVKPDVSFFVGFATAPTATTLFSSTGSKPPKRERNRPSRWQPQSAEQHRPDSSFALDVRDKTGSMGHSVPAVDSIDHQSSIDRPSTSGTNINNNATLDPMTMGFPLQFSSMNTGLMKAPDVVTSSMIPSIFPLPSLYSTANNPSANPFEFLIKQSPLVNNILNQSRPQTGFNNNSIPMNMNLDALQTDSNVILQRLLAGGNSLTTTSNYLNLLPQCSASNDSVTLGNIPTLNTLLNSNNVNFTELFSSVPSTISNNITSNTNTNNNNFTTPFALSNLLNLNLSTNRSNLSLSILPNLPTFTDAGNSTFLTQFLQQQQQQQSQQLPPNPAQQQFSLGAGDLNSSLRQQQQQSHPNQQVDISFLTSFLTKPPPPTIQQIISTANSLNNGVTIPPPPPITLDHLPQVGDSPMDIEDDDNEPSSSSVPRTADKQFSPSSTTVTRKDHRSETTKMADAAMKVALKPYFTKRMISKDEYKEIMKKGVAKLREKNELKPEKVEKFVKQYVELIAKRRQK